MDGARGARGVRHRGVRAPRGEGHLLGARDRREMLAHLRDPRRTEWAAPVVLGAALVVFGFWPRLLLDLIDVTTTGFLDRLAMLAEALPSMSPWLQLLGPALAVAALGRGGARRRCAPSGPRAAVGLVRRWRLLLALLGLSLGIELGGRRAARGLRRRALDPVPPADLRRAARCWPSSARWTGSSRAPAGRQAEYLALVLFSTSGMMMLPGARDWVLLVVSFELMGIPLYALARLGEERRAARPPTLAAEAGLKLFVTGTASSALTFFGLALVVGLSRDDADRRRRRPGAGAARGGGDAAHRRRLRLQDRRGAVPLLGAGHLPGRARRPSWPSSRWRRSWAGSPRSRWCSSPAGHAQGGLWGTGGACSSRRRACWSGTSSP